MIRRAERPARGRSTLFIALAILMVPSAALAAAAPHLDWRTIRTDCCDVHFPIELEPVARRVAVISEESVAAASQLLESGPRDRVHVVIHDVSDSPQGFARVVPFNVIDLRAVPPQGDSDLAVTDEYLRLLIQHEILHVVHLDTIHGLPAVVNVVLGKVWPPNVVQPRFMVEGLATYAETALTEGGRLRSTLFRSDVLIGAFAGDIWALDDVSSYSRRFPGGGGAYAYGALFVEWLTNKYGQKIWPAINHDYGGNAIPYAMQRAVEAATGGDFEEDWRLFVADLRAEVDRLRSRAEARGGPTRARRLTRAGGTIGSVRFAPTGDLFVGLNPPNGPPGLYTMRGLPAATPRLEPVVRMNEAVDVAIVDEDVVVTQIEVTRGFFTFGDLWRVHDGALHRVTFQARLDHPSARPGTRSVIAEHRTAVESALVSVDIDSGEVTDIVRAADGPIWYTPEVSPDGRFVTASRWLPGGNRDIVEIELATGAERSLTADGAQNLEPTYTNDGRHVLFASDREGLFCIYAVERSTGIVRRVVDVLGVARLPRATPDGKGLVYVGSHVEGQDLYAAPLDLESAPIVEEEPPPPFPRRSLTVPAQLPIEPYNPLPTLRPGYWLPIVANDPLGAPALGVALVGQDVAGLFSWAAQATWGTGIERPRVSSSVRFANLWIPLLLTGEWRTDASSAFRRTDGEPELQQEMVLRGSAALQIPLLRQRRTLHSLGLGYARELHFVENPLTARPDERAPLYPPSANIGALTLDWGYTGVESYRDSVSNERGFTSFFRLRHANRLLLSEQDITEVTVDARAFEPVPGLGGHVVGLYLSGGVAFGDPRRRANFSAGGFSDRDLTRDLLEGGRSAAGVLRGYPRASLVGDAFTLATLEYRLPFLEMERGFSTHPIFFDRIHAAAFTDLGMAFDGAPVPTNLLASVGLELRAEVTLGYYGFFLVRAGYARGVSRGGVDQPYIVMGFPY
jgi:hypothetical protein